MKLRPIVIFLILSVLFVIYSFTIYLRPINVGNNKEIDLKKAASGRLVFQKYNCQSCHQLYGLGGHLGPDLTNEYSRLQANGAALRIYFKGGMKQMPRFELSEDEEDLLIEFLKSTDASGSADPRLLKKMFNGMTQQYER